MRLKIKRPSRRRQKGSALLISLMVMVGLSLLGLGFVAVSETESAIAVNERNYVQARAAAEAGVQAVVEMFQDATWAKDRGILPPNTTALKTLRTYDGTETDYYKSNPSDLLFDIPLKGVRGNKFYGGLDTADIMIRWTDGGLDQTYLTALSNALFVNPPGQPESLRISDIRVYAPPWPAATLNAQGFWEGSTPRYGVATIRVTAQKIVNGRVRGERSVKAILAETPFPTVDGAIETSGSLVGQGNFHVYWGKILSEKDMQVNRPAYGMPWFDGKNMMWFEYGYDTSTPHKQNQAYDVGDVVHPAGCLAGDPDLVKIAYQCTTAGTTAPISPPGPDCAAFTANKSPGATVVDGTVGWTVVHARTVRLESDSTFYTNFNWLYQLVERTIPDPWLHARARGTLVYDNSKIVPCSDAVNPHPCDYNLETQSVTGRYSNFFQNLTSTDAGTRPERIEAVFPTMDYEFWKAVAQSGSNDPDSGIYYFEYAGGVSDTHNNFKGPGGKVKDIVTWINAAPLGAGGKPLNGLLPGFYFFDTKNKKSPQFDKGGVLTPEVSINSSSVTTSPKKFQARGYIYMNAENFGSSGVGVLIWDDVYPMPGEPYRDIGFRQVDEATNEYLLNPAAGTIPTADYVVFGVDNRQHDYQDINGNGQLDIFVADVTANNTLPLLRPDGDTTSTPVWLPVPWFEGCTPPNPIADPKVVGDCSEPHEPYLNFIYPDKASPRDGIKIGWSDPSSTVTGWRKPKVRGLTENSTVACTTDSTNSECTSNSWDEDGALVTLQPIVWGALYNEGGYSGSGNAIYYGAILMRGDFNATGTPEVFFDECLARGCLETQLKMQRVFVSSMETD
ncbi:MAG TPA: hypothetical protein VNA69_17310 [Thermoanaerobaculia bacterium]|nr:hypothetical protein [Thermoanaerobaculia bacterium]